MPNFKFLFGRKVLPYGRFNKFLTFSEQELKRPNFEEMLAEFCAKRNQKHSKLIASYYETNCRRAISSKRVIGKGKLKENR